MTGGSSAEAHGGDGDADRPGCDHVAPANGECSRMIGKAAHLACLCLLTVRRPGREVPKRRLSPGREMECLDRRAAATSGLSIRADIAGVMTPIIVLLL